ncbi:MAG: 50S ribosomal protein L13 [Candidatus Fischerbacteria bacterium RBG_13_37_8]|uniref:Large ribosomal subunit protein uL13 n=1 Tax=Candidatus Fischerbacteria bacterium RBG_13_37_8 TaxID=1817863 RepID=A0A1F5VII7_9BACT|nr:MAG: 50S ribosomal protein L13 [Candidatus Fischerbacteria bacterium RBG_13_37_8]
MKTYIPKSADITRKWYLIDANGHTLGRLATCIARLLTGKYKPNYVPFMDTGDFVIVVNVDKIKLTGKKWTDKIYYSHSTYIGGLKEMTARELFKKDPRRLILYAVSGMLPKNLLRKKYEKKLKLYVGEKHPHTAQQPEVLAINFASKKLA